MSPASPSLPVLMNAVYERLPQVLLTSNPRLVLQYIISVLLQLNIESSTVNSDDDDDEHQWNRTRLRERVLVVLNSSVQLTSLQLIQQMAFALHLVTVSLHSLSLPSTCTRRPFTRRQSSPGAYSHGKGECPL